MRARPAGPSRASKCFRLYSKNKGNLSQGSGGAIEFTFGKINLTAVENESEGTLARGEVSMRTHSSYTQGGGS